MTKDKFVSLLERINSRINFLKSVKPNDKYHKQLLFSLYDELEDFKRDLVNYKKELFKRSFVDKADNVDFEERFVLWNDVVKILGEVKK